MQFFDHSVGYSRFSGFTRSSFVSLFVAILSKLPPYYTLTFSSSPFESLCISESEGIFYTFTEENALKFLGKKLREFASSMIEFEEPKKSSDNHKKSESEGDSERL
jgi:hypothetical protein